ncbi:MAG: hypothetical protein ACREUU_18735, partial [Gammaproteobacteria bacterium]
MMQYDIAEILEVRELKPFLKMMQELFESTIGAARFFRITGTPTDLGQISADFERVDVRGLLEEPPNPHGRLGGWNVRPLPPLKRNALGFENENIKGAILLPYRPESIGFMHPMEPVQPL